jgi:hypothetical protein
MVVWLVVGVFAVSVRLVCGVRVWNLPKSCVSAPHAVSVTCLNDRLNSQIE